MQPLERDRWLALALLLAVAGLAYLLVLHPLFTVPLRAADARIGELQARDARARGLLAQQPLIEQRLADALESRALSAARDAAEPLAPDTRPSYHASDWRHDPALPPPPPPPDMGGNHLATLPQLTVAEDASDLAERVRDIERRLTRIEAELAALR